MSSVRRAIVKRLLRQRLSAFDQLYAHWKTAVGAQRIAYQERIGSMVGRPVADGEMRDPKKLRTEVKYHFRRSVRQDKVEQKIQSARSARRLIHGRQ